MNTLGVGGRPFISVMLTSYNYGRYIRGAIESALSQDYADVEVIVSDNASTDNSWEIIESYQGHPRLRAFRQSENIGVANNHFFVLEQARGTHVALLSADDYYLPGHLSRLADVVTRFPDVELPFTDYIVVDAADNVYKRVPHPGWIPASYVDIRDEFGELFAHGPYQTLGTSLMRRDLFADVGPWDVDVVADDFEFLARLAKLRRKFACINVPGIAYRHHGANLSGETFVRNGQQLQDYVVIFEKHALPNMERLRGYEVAADRHLNWRINNALSSTEGRDRVRDLSPRIATIQQALKRNAAAPVSQRRPGEPRISVVIPSKGRLTLLQGALASVAAQTFEDWQIVVVSDGDTDISPYLQTLPYAEKISFLRLDERLGTAGARNAGARVAASQIVCFLDEDDFVGPTQLGNLCAAIEGGSLVAFANANLLLDDYDDNLIKPRVIRERDIEAFRTESAASLLEIAACVPLNCAAFRRDCIDKQGGFNPSLPLVGGWEFLLRMALAFGATRVAGMASVSQRAGLRGQLLQDNAPRYPFFLDLVYQLHPSTTPGVPEARARHRQAVVHALQAIDAAALNSVAGATAFARAFSGYDLV